MKNKSTPKTLEDQIQAIFHIKSFYARDDTVRFHVSGDSITYDRLTQVSDLLGTTNISLETNDGERDGCPTCGYGDTPGYVEVTCRGAKFPVAG